jgi:hypothetical protein
MLVEPLIEYMETADVLAIIAPENSQVRDSFNFKRGLED